MKNIVILGAGTAGTMMANRLAQTLTDGWQITVVDRDEHHVYQPGLLFIPFGMYRAEECVRPRQRFLPPQARLRIGTIDKVDPDGQRVYLTDGESLPYDVLILATGSEIAPDLTPGLEGDGWRDSIYDFYTLDGASALAAKLDDWPGGKLAVHVADTPIKCPVAPLEFALLADAFFTERGRRSDVEISYVTPLDGAFTKPRASELLGGLLAERNIEVVTDFAVEKVDPAERALRSYDGRDVGYDLLVSIPVHRGSRFLGALADDLGFVPTNRNTLQTKAHENIFALGDITDLPSSKAGSVAHFQAEVLAENVARYVEGRALLPDFDGHANCFIETGHGKAMLIDFNYETEPLPGKFPLPGVGPFDLLKESSANHWGKLAFRWVYWNLLITGKDLPIEHRMTMAGKWS